MTDLSPETVGKLVALVRGVANCYPVEGEARGVGSKWINDARAIVAELPEPVDPDLMEAREAVIASVGFGGTIAADRARSGDFDTWPTVIAALAGIKRGRALAAGDR